MSKTYRKFNEDERWKRKGGPHKKSAKQQRKKNRQELQQQIWDTDQDWRGR